MSKPRIPFWAVTGPKVEPPAAKKNAGFVANKPEAAQYFNDWADLVWKWIRGVQHHYGDITVGTGAEVTAGDATHDVTDFVAAIVAGDTVVFLDGAAHAIGLVYITEDDVTLLMESTEAILAFAGDTLAIDQVWGVDVTAGPEFIDNTTGFNDPTDDNFKPFTFTADDDIGDYAAFGAAAPFNRIVFDGLNGTAGTVAVGVWEYMTAPATWAALLNVQDGTAGFTTLVADGQILTFDLPADWTAEDINGVTKYYIRFRTTTEFTVLPSYDQGFVGGTFIMSGARARGRIRTSGAVAADIHVTGADSEVRFEGVEFAGPRFHAIFPLQFPDLTPWAHLGQIGADTPVSGAGAGALAALNSQDVAFIDVTNEDLRTYRFNGTGWTQVGNDLNIVGITGVELTALSATDVAFIDSTIGELRRYTFDGTDWTIVGSGLAIPGGVSNASLAALSDIDVAFADVTGDDLRVYRWNGSTWAQLGNDLNFPGGIGVSGMSALNSTDVAFLHASEDLLEVYRFDGTDWAKIGASLSVSGVSNPAIAALNGTDIAFIDSSNDLLRLFRFDGIRWSPLGPSRTILTGIMALEAMNGTDVAFFDLTDLDLRLFRFGFPLVAPYSAAGGAF